MSVYIWLILGILIGLWIIVGFVGFCLLLPLIARQYRDDIEIWKHDREKSEYIRDYKRYSAPGVIFMGPFGVWTVVKMRREYDRSWKPGESFRSELS